MVDETLAQLETKIRQASALNETQKTELVQLLQALHAEIHALTPTHAEHAESITGFTEVSTYQEAHREQASGRAQRLHFLKPDCRQRDNGHIQRIQPGVAFQKTIPEHPGDHHNAATVVQIDA